METDWHHLRSRARHRPFRSAPGTPGARGLAAIRPGGAADKHRVRPVVVGVVAAAALLLASASAAAQREHDPDTFVTLTIDNDFFAGYDHHYTNGLQLAFSARTTSLPESIRSLPPMRWSAEPRFTFAIGQRIYTPTDTDRADPDPLDRPYAGWLYALADVRTRTGRAVDSVQASVGIIGLPRSPSRRKTPITS